MKKVSTLNANRRYTQDDVSDLINRFRMIARHTPVPKRSVNLKILVELVRFLDYADRSWRLELKDDLNKAGAEVNTRMEDIAFEVDGLVLTVNGTDISLYDYYDRIVQEDY